MIFRKLKNQTAQTAVEYMLLLAVIVAIVITAVPWFFPVTQNAADIYFNRVGIGIAGESPMCNINAYQDGCPCAYDGSLPGCP